MAQAKPTTKTKQPARVKAKSSLKTEPREPIRCSWPKVEDPEYTRYHDEEWGVPKTDDIALFEKMVLEGFQSGLSWITILKKRDNFRRAFHNFDPKKIARYTDKDFERLMADEGIVRNRLKVEATIHNAKAYLELAKERSFADFIWSFVDYKPIINAPRSMKDVPAQTDISKALSKGLKAKGFRFVGPTTAYAFMQSVGMVNDHIADCIRHEPCAKLQRAFRLK